jgi:hypothetical protein
MANIITPGQTLTARSVCDHNCIFTADVLGRSGGFVTVSVHGRVKRIKVFNAGADEFIYAMGRYSMAPVFHAHEAR